MTSPLGWREEDDADLPKGWTWKRSCTECGGPMPVDEIGDFCCDHCEDQYNQEMDADDEDDQ